jgi:hypothetical protein
LIELNQANRGDLVRSPTKDKLAKFIGHLNEQGNDPTSLWYFLSIHENILFPLVEFLQWKRTTALASSSNNKKRSLGIATGSGDATAITNTSNATNDKRPRFEE